MRRFVLRRTRDVSGVSGTGDVADGVEFDDGTCVVYWRGQHRSLEHWPSAKECEEVHGHAGLTAVVYLDFENPGVRP
jgi:hypothetical protein